MPDRKEEKKQDRGDSRGEHGDITRASASSPPPPERYVARGDLSTRFTKDSQNQETNDSKSRLLCDLVLTVLVFSVVFGCGFGVRGTSQPAPDHPQLQTVIILSRSTQGSLHFSGEDTSLKLFGDTLAVRLPCLFSRHSSSQSCR